MNTPKAVFLTGFMGCGKSTVGPLLADLLAWPFVDLDQLIEARSGMSITDIFALHGEAAFRKMECETLADVAHSSVVALGGGAFLQAPIRRLIRCHGVSIFLEWTWPVLAARIAADGDVRPLGRHPARAKMLYESRLPIYRCADFVWRSQPPYREQPDQIAKSMMSRL